MVADASSPAPATTNAGRYAVLPPPQQPPRRPRDPRRPCPRTALGAAVLWLGLLLAAAVGAAGTALFWFTEAFDDALIDELVLRNGTLAFDMWQRPPVHPTIRVRIFNYTNAEEVKNGARPRVEEVGPYTFRQRMEKVDVVFDGEEVVRFRESTEFEPLPELSAELDNATVTLVSVPLVSASSVLRDASIWKQLQMQIALTAAKPSPFLSYPPRDFLFGYKEALTDLAKSFAIINIDPQSLKLGILESRAGVSPDELEVETGAGDPDRLGLIRSVGGRSSLGVWGPTPCSAVDGSDGTLFPPRAVHRRQRLHLFSKDMCRKLPLDFVRTDTFAGLEALVYAPPLHAFGTPKENPENACFCRKRKEGEKEEEEEEDEEEKRVCTGQAISGVFDVGACNFNAPVLVSFPHFYGGDPILRSFVDGLQEPDPKRHSMYFYIHPLLGVPMGATTRFQMNVKVRKSDRYHAIDFLQEGAVLPVAWIEITSDSLPPDVHALLSSATTKATAARHALMYGSVLVLAVALALTAWCCWARVLRGSKAHADDAQVLQPL